MIPERTQLSIDVMISKLRSVEFPYDIAVTMGDDPEDAADHVIYHVLAVPQELSQGVKRQILEHIIDAEESGDSSANSLAWIHTLGEDVKTESDVARWFGSVIKFLGKSKGSRPFRDGVATRNWVPYAFANLYDLSVRRGITESDHYIGLDPCSQSWSNFGELGLLVFGPSQGPIESRVEMKLTESYEWIFCAGMPPKTVPRPWLTFVQTQFDRAEGTRTGV